MQNKKIIENPKIFQLKHGKSEITLTKEGFIRIQNAKASIELHTNGQIIIHGAKDINLEANRHIHLNRNH